MNCVKKNANRYIAALVAVIMAMTAFAVVADASDAASARTQIFDVSADDFTEDKSSTLHIKVNCIDDDGDHITVTVKENDKVLKTAEYDVGYGETPLDISFSVSKGTHELTIYVVDGTQVESHASITINAKDDVWSNITTYLAIVFLAIIIIIIIVVYMRANPRNKPTTTFTELERQKKEAAANAEEPAKPSKSTGKIKYESSRRK